jgi:hypothetical protein
MQLAAAAAARPGFVPRELSACLCVTKLDFPDGVESIPVPPEKVGLLKSSAASPPFTNLDARACAGVGSGDTAGFLRKPDWIVHEAHRTGSGQSPRNTS